MLEVYMAVASRSENAKRAYEMAGVAGTIADRCELWKHPAVHLVKISTWNDYPMHGIGAGPSDNASAGD